MNLPAGEQPYVTSFEEMFWGGGLVAITMAIHGFGMLWVLSSCSSLKQRFEKSPSFVGGILILILASWMIMLVHLIEVCAWTAFFHWTAAVNTTGGSPANVSLCYYFALMDYTTLGSSYNLHLRWRLLEGMIAMAGLLTFAWSTGVLLTLASEFQEQQMQLLKQRRDRQRPKKPPGAAHPHAGELDHPPTKEP